MTWLMPLLKALGPTLLGIGASKVMSGGSSAPSAGAGTTGAGAELERLALERVRSSQPLYQAVLQMAQSRLPRSAPGPVGAAVPRVASAGIPQDQYAQSIVDEFRKRTGREY